MEEIKEMELMHASGEIVKNPQIILTEHTKDFSWGFYCTNNYRQAKRWGARRKPTPTINYYRLENTIDLKILRFEKMTDEWLDFVAKCRSGETHEYDIVEGPMADDQVWNFVDDFLDGNLIRKHFAEYAAFQYPTHQVSFHTIKALTRLKFVRSERIHEN